MAASTSGSTSKVFSLPRVPPRIHRNQNNRNDKNIPNSMFVVDPKTFATRLLIRPKKNFDQVFIKETESKFVRFIAWLKKLSESWFTHFFLLIALILYALLGGFIFSSIEGKHEMEQNEILKKLHQPIDLLANELIEDLWVYRNQFPMPSDLNDYEPIIDQQWRWKVLENLQKFQKKIFKQCEKRLNNYSIERFQQTNRWDFIGSVFFSMTVFTTIGYGDNPPATSLGHLATMIYSFFGIPLLLIVLADFGRIFTKLIKFLILTIRRLYYDRSMRSVRHLSRTYTNNKTQQVQKLILQTMEKLQRNPPFFIDQKTGKVTILPPSSQQQPSSTTTMIMSPPVRPPRTFQPQQQQKPQTANIPMINLDQSSPATTITPDTPMPAMIAFEDLDDEFNLPISLALFILLLYLFFGAILFWSSENWSLFHSFYFVFISMSTIGFGDFVPTQFNVLLYAFIYFLFGLALTSMCINVIQEKLSSTFEKARITIGESIGLDPKTPITIIRSTEHAQQQQPKSS